MQQIITDKKQANKFRNPTVEVLMLKCVRSVQLICTRLAFFRIFTIHDRRVMS
jgi:hypothetical protein